MMMMMMMMANREFLGDSGYYYYYYYYYYYCYYSYYCYYYMLTTYTEDCSPDGEEEGCVRGWSVKSVKQFHKEESTGFEVARQQSEIYEQP